MCQGVAVLFVESELIYGDGIEIVFRLIGTQERGFSDGENIAGGSWPVENEFVERGEGDRLGMMGVIPGYVSGFVDPGTSVELGVDGHIGVVQFFPAAQVVEADAFVGKFDASFAANLPQYRRHIAIPSGIVEDDTVHLQIVAR